MVALMCYNICTNNYVSNIKQNYMLIQVFFLFFSFDVTNIKRILSKCNKKKYFLLYEPLNKFLLRYPYNCAIQNQVF